MKYIIMGMICVCVSLRVVYSACKVFANECLHELQLVSISSVLCANAFFILVLIFLIV